MTCDERENLILLYAADLLDEDQHEEIRAHLASGCAKCNAVLKQAREMLEEIPASIAPIAPPVAARERLMLRAKARRTNFLPVALAACVGLLIGGLALYFYGQSKLPGPQKVIALASPTNSSASGIILWDQKKQCWCIYVANLKPISGRTFEVWYITAQQQKIRAMTFNTNSTGEGQNMVDLPKNIGRITTAAVTDEPPGGSDQPTGSIQLVGNIN